MLTLLRVRNFAIIDELEVEFGPGLNVVTGETGAGKSILVAALQLVLGAKGRPEVVRTGAKQAEVEALFDLRRDPSLRERLASIGLEDEAEGGELVVRRVIASGGRARAYVNGRLTPRSQLEAIAAGLADISSQHEHHTLADSRSHLEYLDAFGQLEARRERVAAEYATVLRAQEAFDALSGAERDRLDREDLLRFQVSEIDELAPVPGELDELEAERERLRHAHELASAAGGAEDVLYARDGSLSEELSRVAQQVREAAEIDPRLAPFASQLEESLSTLEDVAADLGRYARDVQVDPERLAEVEERLDRLGRLLRKYGRTLEAVLAHRDQAAEELEALEHHEERLLELERARDAALQAAAALARKLSEARRKAGAELATRISAELSSLGMGGARVVVELAKLDAKSGGLTVDGARLSARGIDRAEFLIAPNKGEQARPLSKVASGGELSRAMLAIKRTLAGLGPAGLYVFDEVDTGVGGAVAEVIGRKLLEVAEHHQVLCITHLPQIAIYGEPHFHVEKRVSGERTYSEIRRLGEDERIEELARMVGGVNITDRTRAAAAEMLEHARR